MMSIAVTKAGNFSALDESLTAFRNFATPKDLPLGGPQRRLFDSVKPKAIKTERKSHQMQSLSVSLHGIVVGEIRHIDGAWGWRTRTIDRTYANPETAAIAYTKWAILNTWGTLSTRFQGVV